MPKVLGCNINVVESGVGQPIVFLHGNPDSALLWAPIAESLATSHRCIIPDLPGYGHSSVTPGFDFSLNGLANFVEALYLALRLDVPVHLVGHDFGGIAGAAWMAAHSSRVRSFTVCNAVFSAAYRWHYWARIWRTPLLGELSMVAMNRLVFGLELRRGSRKLTREQIDSTYAMITPSVKDTVLQLYRAVRQTSFIGWEERYQQAAKEVPVMALWGEGDPYIPASFAQTFGAQRVVTFPGAGHWLPAVEPALVVQELRSFISGAALYLPNEGS
jgi:pimeloyl-ACP methyl ester carboxylesterase